MTSLSLNGLEDWERWRQEQRPTGAENYRGQCGYHSPVAEDLLDGRKKSRRRLLHIASGENLRSGRTTGRRMGRINGTQLKTKEKPAKFLMFDIKYLVKISQD
jgi:hypothetical protein